MARRNRAEQLEDDEPGLEISSLIDICFLLLIYFIVTTTLIPKERDQKSSIPTTGGESSEKSKIPPFFIRVDRSGVIYTKSGTQLETLDQDSSVNDTPLLDSRLSLYSSACAASDATPVVQFYVESDTVYQRVVDVFSALAEHNIDTIAFTDVAD